MNLSKIARAGATLLIAWGALHVLGGGMILSGLATDAETGFSVYQNSDGNYPALAGNVLGYFAYLLICISVAVIAIGILYNWKNSQGGLAVNTAIIIAVEIGLVVFLVFPGFVPIAEASVGFVLAAVGIVLSGIACSREHAAEVSE